MGSVEAGDTGDARMAGTDNASTAVRRSRRRGLLIAAAVAAVVTVAVLVWAFVAGRSVDDQATQVSVASSSTLTTVEEGGAGAPSVACGIALFDGLISGARLVTDGSLTSDGERDGPITLMEVRVDGMVEVVVQGTMSVTEGAVIDADTSRLWLEPESRLIDVDAVRRDEVQGDALLLGAIVQLESERAFFLTQALAPIAADGTVHMEGECGDEVQRDLEAGAAVLGRPVDVEFLTDMLEGDRDVLGAIEQVTAASNPDEQELNRQTWLDTPVERRSLRVEDVPIEERASYELLVLTIAPTDLGVGPMVGVMTDAGVLQSFVPGSQIIAPVMVPTGENEVRIAMAVNGPGLFETENVVATFPLSAFDPVTGGAALVFEDSPDGPRAVLRPLLEGELEELTGMTRAELEARREQLLAR